MSMVDIVSDKQWQIINNKKHFWQEGHIVPEREIDLEQNKTEKREHTNLRILKWIHSLPADGAERQSIQQVDLSAAKHVKEKRPLFSWTATERLLDIPAGNLSSAPSTRMSINIFFAGEWVRTYPRQNLNDKETQGNERNLWTGIGAGWSRTHYGKKVQDQI